MNLPNDVARCNGILNDGTWCPHMKSCERHLQMIRDDAFPWTDEYPHLMFLTNCLADGEYTALIKTKETQC